MSSVFFWEPTGINGLLCFCPRPFFDDRGALLGIDNAIKSDRVRLGSDHLYRHV